MNRKIEFLMANLRDLFFMFFVLFLSMFVGMVIGYENMNRVSFLPIKIGGKGEGQS